MPQGLRCSSDHFLQISDEALRCGGLIRYIKNFNNILLYAKTLKELVENFHNLLEICRDNWITLQPKKLGLLTPDASLIKYAGVNVSHLGIYPHKEKLQAITEMRPPRDITEVRCLLGMINR